MFDDDPPVCLSPGSPTADLLRLRRAAAESFDRDGELYVPHLSLVYGGLCAEERVRLARSIDAESLPGTVRVDAVEVVETSGSVPEWRTVSTHALGADGSMG